METPKPTTAELSIDDDDDDEDEDEHGSSFVAYQRSPERETSAADEEG